MTAKTSKRIRQDFQFTLRMCSAFLVIWPIMMIALYVFDLTNISVVFGAFLSTAFTILVMRMNAPDLWFLRRGPIIEIDDALPFGEVVAWLEECCPNRFKMLPMRCIKFYDKRDVTTFMLMWK